MDLDKLMAEARECFPDDEVGATVEVVGRVLLRLEQEAEAAGRAARETGQTVEWQRHQGAATALTQARYLICDWDESR